jgi:hypothetical protein
MAQIIRMDEFHGARTQHPGRRATDRDPREKLFCTRCQCESFSLLLSGEVNCVNCGALIRNLRVAVGAPAATP